jgi:hypothetical protein
MPSEDVFVEHVDFRDVNLDVCQNHRIQQIFSHENICTRQTLSNTDMTDGYWFREIEQG